MEQIISASELAEFVSNEEVLRQIGVGLDDKVEVKIFARSMTVRSLNDEEEAEALDALAEKLFEKRREAYQELAKGPQ